MNTSKFSEWMNGRSKDYALVLTLAVVGGGGGSAIQGAFWDPRPDPFTGTEGNALELRVRILEESSEKKWSRLEDMLTVLHRIENQIAALPPKEWRDRIRELERHMYKQSNGKRR